MAEIIGVGIEKVEKEIIEEMFLKELMKKMPGKQNTANYLPNQLVTNPITNYPGLPNYPGYGPTRRPNTTHTKEDKIEILDRIAKAWLQMPDDLGLADVLTIIGNHVTLTDKDLATCLEVYVEQSKRDALYREFQEAYASLNDALLKRSPNEMKDLISKFKEFVAGR